MNREGGRLSRLGRAIPAALLCAVIVVYCAYHLLASLTPKPVVEPALLADFTETVTLSGYVFRSEEILTAATPGVVLATRGEGEKVAAGSLVARVYASLNEETYDALKAVRRRLAILNNARTSYSSIKNVPGILVLLEETMRDYREAVDANDMDRAMELRDAILAARTQYQALISGYTSYHEVIAALEAQAVALEAGLGTPLLSVSAPYSGYYYRTVDGYERIFRASEIDSLTVDSFRAVIGREPETYVDDTSTAGKLITDHTWYVVAETDSASAAAFTAGATYSVRFLAGDDTVEMTLYRTATSSREDAVLLIFSSARVAADFDFTRAQRVEITARSGEGYTVPKAAVRNVNGRTGVYVLDRYVVRFREIAIIGEQNGIYYCDPSYAGEGRLRLYDSVIVSGKDLYDGKVLD